jgi:branched-subunit amino acid transport protein
MSQNLWPLFLACGALTFLIRYSFIGAEGRIRLPSWFQRLLPFVPVAALTALIAPDVFLIAGQLQLGLDNPRLWAAVVAIIVAALWRNTLLTIFLGFVAFSALRLLA